MKQGVILLIMLSISVVNCLAQNKINFIPKQLMNEIKRQYKCNNPVFTEINNTVGMVEDTSFEKYFKIGHCQQYIGYVFIGRVKTCRAGVCSLPDKFRNDSYEFFDYFILFDSTAKILAVNIFNYEATHGHEITVKSWLKQFVGFDGSNELIVGKNIDAISGATISVHSITLDISSKTKALKKYLLENTANQIPSEN